MLNFAITFGMTSDRKQNLSRQERPAAMDVLIDPWLFRVSDQSCESLSVSCATAWNCPHGFRQPRNAPTATASCQDAARPRRLSYRYRATENGRALGASHISWSGSYARQSLQLMISGLRCFSKRHSTESRAAARIRLAASCPSPSKENGIDSNTEFG